MAEVSARETKKEKKVYLVEDFESVAQHWVSGGGEENSGQRRAEYAYRGHAGVLIVTKTNNPGDSATVQWYFPPPDERYITVEVFWKILALGTGGKFIILYQEQGRTEQETVKVYYETANLAWYYVRRDGAVEQLSEITTKLPIGTWHRIRLEIDRQEKRIQTIRINNESYRVMKEYNRTSLPQDYTTARLLIAVETATNDFMALGVDDVAVYEL